MEDVWNRISLVVKHTTQNFVQTPKAYVIVGDLTHSAFQNTFNSHVNLYGSNPQNGSVQSTNSFKVIFSISLYCAELILVNYKWCLNEYLWSNEDLSRWGKSTLFVQNNWFEPSPGPWSTKSCEVLRLFRFNRNRFVSDGGQRYILILRKWRNEMIRSTYWPVAKTSIQSQGQG